MLKGAGPAQELGEHRVVTGGQPELGGGRGNIASEHARGTKIIAPPADRAAQPVDVQVRCQRVSKVPLRFSQVRAWLIGAFGELGRDTATVPLMPGRPEAGHFMPSASKEKRSSLPCPG